MHGAIEGEIERIEREERQLEEGERLLAGRRFEEAAQRFRGARNALLKEHQDKASDGLGRAEEEIRLFQEEVERGRTSDDPYAAVEAFRAAHERWASGPDMPEVLIDALLLASEAALEDGQEKEASTYSQEVLELDPDKTWR